MSMRTGEEVYKTRKALAAMFGITDPQQIVFTNNTSQALNMAIKGVLAPGDHVITTSMEHNSVLRPLKALESPAAFGGGKAAGKGEEDRPQGIKQTVIRCWPDGSLDPESVRLAFRPNTRLIVMTHASNVVGTILPVAEVGRIVQAENQRRQAAGDSREILFLIDGAQSAGSVPIDVTDLGADLFAAPGHKGLLGPLGTGLLYVRPGLSLRPLMEGGTGTASKERIQPREYPEGYEVGTINAPGIIGLRHSVEFVERLGVARIGEYETDLIRPLDGALRNMEGLTVYGPSDCKRKTGIVAFNITGKPGLVRRQSCEETAAALNDQYGIAVRGGYHCAGLAHRTIGTWETGAVRMSVGPFTTSKEIRIAIEAVHRISRS